MGQDSLFNDLCKPDVMRIGWYLAQGDSRDDFVSDPIGHADFALNLDERLQHLVEQVQTFRYRPHHLLEVDVPKTGLSVRPGNVLPIEEASLLHAIVYLLAPYLDKRLDDSVFSYRLHPNFKQRLRKRKSLFREAEIEFPFLKKETLRSISPFDAWYELWPEFEAKSIKACTEEGFTHLTKTDITAYFENIDLRLLENQIRSLLKKEEDKILQVLFRVLEGWTRVTSSGTPIERGIPQGNEVSSFLGNLYLIPLDRALNKFCTRNDARWFRYVDDVKVFTKSEQHAREVVFIINETLRTLHLNLQGSKTEILSEEDLRNEIDNSELQSVDVAIEVVRKLNPKLSSDRKLITRELVQLNHIKSQFTAGLPKNIESLNGKKNRLFRRLMTLFSICSRPQMRNAALMAISHLPDIRVLNKSLSYISSLEMKHHDWAVDELFQILEKDQLPFPYQAAIVLETISRLNPSNPNQISSRIRRFALVQRRDWIVVQKGLECIMAYPYRDDHSLSLANKFLRHEHPMVRRAACVLLSRSPREKLKVRLNDLIYHADPGTNRLALFFLRFTQDESFVIKELVKMQKGNKNEFAFQRSLPTLYAMVANNKREVALKVREYIESIPKTRSAKINWQINNLMEKIS
ncbi:reverse transcriptase domain-containing protein [Nitrospina sp. 32_T5]|uniref:RNA-directed DNA polymerase n=1 Tax=unclassified Nitrospina TaxID=2638683 RepID=UPI003F9A8F2E